MRLQWILTAFVVTYGAAALLGVAALPPATWAAYDHVNYHLPTIQTFARDLPAVDLVNYQSATTPGWHLAMALIYRASNGSIVLLRLLQIALSLFLMALLLRFALRRLAPHVALAVILPFAGSFFVFDAAVWLVTDNIALLSLFGVLATLLQPRVVGAPLRLAISASAALLVRQINAWTIPFAGAILLGDSMRAGRGDLRRVAAILTRTLLPFALGVVPAVVAFLWLALQWRGLTPPGFQGEKQELAGAPLVMNLGLMAVFGVFFLPGLFSGLRARGTNLRSLLLPVALASAASILIASLPRTTYAEPDRASGLWILARLTPAVLERSPAMILLAGCGAAIIVLAHAAMEPRARSVLTPAVLVFMLVQCLNRPAYQRYYEGFLLMWWALAAALSFRSGTPHETRSFALTWMAPLGLGLVQLGVIVLRVARALEGSGALL